MMEEIYAQNYSPADPVTLKPLGVTAGEAGSVGTFNGKPVIKRVYHPKAGDLFKTLFDKKAVNFVATGAARCLDITDNDLKPIVKVQKSLPPTKHNNRLLAEALALKIGIAASDLHKSPEGFGDLVYVGGGLLNNQTVRQIAVKLDKVLSCDSTGSTPKDTALTPGEAFTAAHAINAAFSGAFDT